MSYIAVQLELFNDKYIGLIYDGMLYGTLCVNREFKIKLYGTDINGVKCDKLVGVAGLIKSVGVKYANRFIERALKFKGDKLVCKVRNGMKVTFYRE